jgi:hypothetical protein
LTARGWRLTARAGLTIPLGRTEEDPFALGDMGLQHQHIQLGTGTANPVVAAEIGRSWGAWRAVGFGLTQQVVYENSKGYQAGDRYALGFGLRRGSARRGRCAAPSTRSARRRSAGTAWSTRTTATAAAST